MSLNLERSKRWEFIIRWLVRLISALGFVLSLSWFLSGFDYEPAILILTSVGAFLVSFRTRQEKTDETATPHKPFTSSLSALKPPPRRVKSFITRYDKQGRDYVGHLCKILTDSQHVRITVWGNGGVGKTTLVNEIIQQLYPDPFSGGIFWISADGYTGFGLTTLLDSLVIALDRSQLRQLPLDQRKAELLRLMSNAPSLVVLDNFETIDIQEQSAIADFVRDAPFSLLLTSRSRFPLGQHIQLDPMTPHEARQFLAIIVAASDQPAWVHQINPERIRIVAEHNPLLMEWVISQLEMAMSPQDVLEELSQGTGDAADRIFERSFRLLEHESQTVLIALALFVPDTTRIHLMTVCNLSKRRLNAAVRQLAQLRFIELDIEKDRLLLVALPRHLVCTRLQNDNRSDSMCRCFVAHFVDYAQSCHSLDELESELGNLLAAVEYAHSDRDWTNAKRLVDLLTDTGGLLEVRCHWDEALRLCYETLEIARRTNDEIAVARFAYLASFYVLYQQGELAKTESLLYEALTIQRKISDHQAIAQTLLRLALTTFRRNEYEQAKQWYAESLVHARQVGNELNVATILHDLGWLAIEQGQWNNATTLLNESQSICQEIGNIGILTLSSVMRALGQLATERGELDKAMRHYEEALAIQHKIGGQRDIAWTLNYIANLERKRNRLGIARRTYEQSLSGFRKAGYYHGIACVQHDFGLLEIQENQLEAAMHRFQESQNIFNRIGHPSGIARVLFGIGKVNYCQGNLVVAHQLFQDSLDALPKLINPQIVTAIESEIQKIEKEMATVQMGVQLDTDNTDNTDS